MNPVRIIWVRPSPNRVQKILPSLIIRRLCRLWHSSICFIPFVSYSSSVDCVPTGSFMEPRALLKPSDSTYLMLPSHILLIINMFSSIVGLKLTVYNITLVSFTLEWGEGENSIKEHVSLFYFLSFNPHDALKLG